MNDIDLAVPRKLCIFLSSSDQVKPSFFTKITSKDYQILALDNTENLWVCGINDGYKLGFTAERKVVKHLTKLTDLKSYNIFDISIGEQFSAALGIFAEAEFQVNLQDFMSGAKVSNKKLCINRAETLVARHKELNDGSELHQKRYIKKSHSSGKSNYIRIVEKIYSADTKIEKIKQTGGIKKLARRQSILNQSHSINPSVQNFNQQYNPS